MPSHDRQITWSDICSTFKGPKDKAPGPNDINDRLLRACAPGEMDDGTTPEHAPASGMGWQLLQL